MNSLFQFNIYMSYFVTKNPTKYNNFEIWHNLVKGSLKTPWPISHVARIFDKGATMFPTFKNKYEST